MSEMENKKTMSKRVVFNAAVCLNRHATFSQEERLRDTHTNMYKAGEFSTSIYSC